MSSSWWKGKAFDMPDKIYYSAKSFVENRVLENIPQMLKSQLNVLLSRFVDSYAIETECEPMCISGKSYFDYQKAGIEYMMKVKKVLLGDDQGLGKTVQIAGLLYNLEKSKEKLDKILIICPKSLKENWKKELLNWTNYTEDEIEIIEGRKYKMQGKKIAIVNYDLCHYLKKQIGRRWDFIAIDECQYIMNHEANRTISILGPGGIARRAPRVVAMSGTPISNRPIELWPIMATLFAEYTPDDFINRDNFILKFCDGFKETVKKYDPKKRRTVTKQVLNARGASNLKLLGEILRERFMIRRVKKNVLKQLPPKLYNIVDISADAKQKQVLMKEDSYKYDVLKSIETGKRLPELEELSSVRKEIALMKIDFATKYIDGILDNQDKVIVFCHHTEVAEQLAFEFEDFGVSLLLGKTSQNKRNQAVEDFQNGENRVFIGNLKAAGVGLTLTAASEVVFVECSWTPGDNEQAVDRAHRISQTKQVSAHFLVWYGSLDATILRTSINKKHNIDKVMQDL